MKLEAETQKRKTGPNAPSVQRTPPSGRVRAATGRKRKRPGQAKTKARRGSDPTLLYVGLGAAGLLLLLVGGYVATQGDADPSEVADTDASSESATEGAEGSARRKRPASEGPPQITEEQRRELAAIRSQVDRHVAAEQEQRALALLDAFVAEHGDLPEALDARDELLDHCREVVTNQRGEALAAIRKGRALKATTLVAKLRSRLPAACAPEIDRLGVELEREAAKAERELARAKDAAADTEPADPDAEPAEPEQPEPTDEDPAEPKPDSDPAPDDDSDDSEDDDDPVAWPGGERPDPSGGKPDVAKPPVPKPDADKPSAPVEPKPGHPKPLSPEEGRQPDTSSPLATKLRNSLRAPHKLRRDGLIQIAYRLRSGGEGEDFKAKGFDAFGIDTVTAADYYATGLTMSTSTQRMGRMVHELPIKGNFQISFSIWIPNASSRSKVVFLIGDEIGVSWGQQIVKVSKRGSLRPLTRGNVDLGAFRVNKAVDVTIAFQQKVMTVELDHRRVARKVFKKGGPKGRFGLMAQGVRLQMHDLAISGVVDADELE